MVNDLCSKNRFTVTEITAVDTESKNFVDGKKSIQDLKLSLKTDVGEEYVCGVELQTYSMSLKALNIRISHYSSNIAVEKILQTNGSYESIAEEQPYILQICLIENKELFPISPVINRLVPYHICWQTIDYDTNEAVKGRDDCHFIDINYFKRNSEAKPKNDLETIMYYLSIDDTDKTKEFFRDVPNVAFLQKMFDNENVYFSDQNTWGEYMSVEGKNLYIQEQDRLIKAKDEELKAQKAEAEAQKAEAEAKIQAINNDPKLTAEEKLTAIMALFISSKIFSSKY